MDGVEACSKPEPAQVEPLQPAVVARCARGCLADLADAGQNAATHGTHTAVTYTSSEQIAHFDTSSLGGGLDHAHT